MIASQDRSGYFGASDTKYIVGNWNTKTFEKWWLEKLGIHKSNFSNEYTKAGTNYEHRILDALDIVDLEKDKQVIEGKLRVNLDGNTKDAIYEVKTYLYKKGFKLLLSYKQQVWVQMYGTNFRKAYFVIYGLEKKDYRNYFRKIDMERLDVIPIEYNEKFIEEEYIPKLKYLTDCLKKGSMPSMEEFNGR